MKVLVNAVSATMGGGITYLLNLVPRAVQLRGGLEFVFCVRPDVAAELRRLCPDARIRAVDAGAGTAWQRIWWDQIAIRRVLKEEKASVLFSAANFGTLRPPCPQVLFVRQPIYFSDHYLREILPRYSARMRIETRLRRWLVAASARASDVVMTPSASMMEALCRFVSLAPTKRCVNHFGTDAAEFKPAAGGGDGAADRQGGKVLFYASHYADHKNLGTLLRAMLELHEEGERDLRLVTPADPRLSYAKQFITSREDEKLAYGPLQGRIRFTGPVRHGDMAALYRSSDIFVFPSFAESFGHPLLEAMASGLPIVASDIPTHRELCGNAALYFTPFDSHELAVTIRLLLGNRELQTQLRDAGRKTVARFTWEAHIAKLVTVLTAVGENGRKAIRLAAVPS